MNDNLNISDLSIGVSKTGIDEFMTDVTNNFMQKAVDAINNADAVITAINAGWQGVSRDAFLAQFETSRQKVCDAITQEELQLWNVISAIKGSYYMIDQELMNDEL